MFNDRQCVFLLQRQLTGVSLKLLASSKGRKIGHNGVAWLFLIVIIVMSFVYKSPHLTFYSLITTGLIDAVPENEFVTTFSRRTIKSQVETVAAEYSLKWDLLTVIKVLERILQTHPFYIMIPGSCLLLCEGGAEKESILLFQECTIILACLVCQQNFMTRRDNCWILMNNSGND